MVVVPVSLYQEKGSAPAAACITDGEVEVEGMLDAREGVNDADLPGGVLLASGDGEGEGDGVDWVPDDGFGQSQ